MIRSYSLRVDGRSYLLSGAIDGSEANGIIHDPKLEVESSRFAFDLVPLSYESVDVIKGDNWLLRHKAEMVCHEKVVKMLCVPKKLIGFTPRRGMGFRMELVQGATPICEGSCHLTPLRGTSCWNDCKSCKVRVGLNGNSLWEASVLLGRKKGGRVYKDDVAKNIFRMRNGDVEVCGYAFWANQYTSGFHGVNEQGREDVREVFQQRGSGAKRNLSRRGRDQMGNEPILALPEGADDFVVLKKDCMTNMVEGLNMRKSRWMKLFSEYSFEAKYHLRKANVVVESWSRKKSKAKNEFWIDV
ncbi:hypothetical protein Tco_1549577 [Tanacetum coccineum]